MKKEQWGKKSPGSLKAYQFWQHKCHWKKDYKHRREWLKKKGKAVEADVAISGFDTEVLMTHYFGDNSSQGKNCIFDSDSTIHVCSVRRCSTPWFNGGGTVKMFFLYWHFKCLLILFLLSESL